MKVVLSDTQTIKSNPCGGFEYHEATRNKATGELILRDGKPRFRFIMYMRSLEQLLVKIHEKQWHIATEAECDVQRIIDEGKRIEAALIDAVARHGLAHTTESTRRRPAK